MSLSDPRDILAAVVIDLVVILAVVLLVLAAYGTATAIYRLRDRHQARRNTAAWQTSARAQYGDAWGDRDDAEPGSDRWLQELYDLETEQRGQEDAA